MRDSIAFLCFLKSSMNLKNIFTSLLHLQIEKSFSVFFLYGLHRLNTTLMENKDKIMS